MNDQRHDNTPIAPPTEHTEPALAADELVSHGLLTFLNNDPPAETERRMRNLMRRIADESPVHAGVRSHRLVFPHARRWIALAACFVIASALVYLGLPTTGSAQAMVLASAASLREPGDRRFEVRVQPRGSKELQETPIGTIDTRGRGAELMVARMQPEEGVWITFGRDATGPWLVYPDGRLERNPPAGALPRLGVVADQPVLPESVDRVLEELASAYTLERTTEKGADGTSSTEHIVGLRRADRAPGVPRIDLWLDAKTNTVKKVELTLPDPPIQRGMGPGRRPDGPGGPEGPDGPRGDRGRRPPPPDGLGEGDEGNDGPLPPPRDGRGPGRRGPDDPEGRGPGGGPNGRGLRGGPSRIELRPVPPPPFPPEWFGPEHHAKRPPAQRP